MPNTNSEPIQTIAAFILKYAYTQGQIMSRIRLIKEYMEHKYFMDNSSATGSKIIDTLLPADLATEIDREFLQAFESEYISFFNPESLYTLTDGLKKEFLKYPRVMLHLPVTLDSDAIKVIGMWIREHIDNHAIIVPFMNPSIAAGCGIGWNNYYQEYSFRTKLEQVRPQLRSLLPPL